MSRGYFRDEGLTVIPKISPEIRFDKFRKGEFDIHLDNNVQLIMAQADGFDLSFVAENDIADRGLLLVSTINPEIDSVEDLKGKRVGLDRRGNFIELLITISLAAHNVDPDSVKFVPVPIPKMPQAMLDKKVDAAWVSAGFYEQMEIKAGARRVTDLIDGPTARFPVTSFAASREFAQKNPNTVAAFNRAIVRAQRVREDDLSAYYQALSKVLGIPQEAANVLAPAPGVSTTNPVRLQRVADLLYRFKFTRKRVDIKSMIAPSIRSVARSAAGG